MPTFSIDLLDIFIIAGVAQGFLLLILCFRFFNENSAASALLSGLVLMLVWLQLEFLAIRGVVSIPVPGFYGTRFGAWLAIGPLILFYQRALRNPRFIWRKAYYWHFLPFLLFVVILPIFFAWQLHPHAINYGLLVYLRHPDLAYNGWYFFYLVLFPFQFIQLSLYLIKAQRELKTYESTLQEHLAKLEAHTLSWFRQLLVWLTVLVVATLLFLLLSPYLGLYIRELDFIYIFPMVAIVYSISFKSFRQESIFGKINPPNLPASNAKKYEKSALTPVKAKQLKQQLLDHMLNQKSHLNNELTLRSLAEELQVPPYQLSQLLNEHFKKSFFDFINGYRIQEVISFIDNTGHKKPTLLEAAFACGFNNKTSFINNFKKHTGQTPSKYFRTRNQMISKNK